jgi:hypothetical protein
MPSQHQLPGYNETAADPDDCKPFEPLIPTEILYRKVVLIATAPITEGCIFSNGLYQNIFIIYKMLNAMGFLPFFLQNGPADAVLNGCRVIDVQAFVKKPFPVYMYLEIGMSVDTFFRKFLKSLGARNVKIYLGNILNIDIETIQFYQSAFFNHHVVGEMDEIWVSPHYEQHREYAGYLNRVYNPANMKIVPYVWDPCFITRFGRENYRWKTPEPDARPTYIIMEPNISFQKNALIPLLALEAYKEKNKDWNPRIVIVNGERLKACPHFSENVAGNLTIQPHCEYRKRAIIVDLFREFPSATFICHQVNNEYNYMILELLHAGFPIIHNGERWSAYGYTYSENDIDGLHKCLEDAKQHVHNVDRLLSQAQALFWRYSIHNPQVQRAWFNLLGAPYPLRHS